MQASNFTAACRLLVIATIILITLPASAQKIYESLPVGKYAVGFKIITLTDSSRMVQPEYNYLGEKNEGDRFRKVSIHLWYPAQDELAKRRLTYGDYCYNRLLTSTNEVIDTASKNAHLAECRQRTERWFGATTNDAWQTLLSAPMLARAEATEVAEKCPLLIGTLRELSTSISNELLASNGYVVAMITEANTGSFAGDALQDIPEMQFAMHYLSNNMTIDIDKLGCFGFSGSGFVPLLFGMHDSRVKAMADIESGVYMDVLYQSFAVSNYYQPSKLTIPFLHIFTRDLSKQEKFISDFTNKTNHAARYRLIVNQPGMHHWDNAAEGYTSCIFLHNRGDKETNTKKCFEIESNYLLNFFNAMLKDDAQSKTFLSAKPQLASIPSSLWDIDVLPATKRAPTLDELTYIIQKKGIKEAMEIVNSTIQGDSATDIRVVYMLNGTAYSFFRNKKYDEAIALFKLNTTLHPGDVNVFDSLAEVYEATGDTENMKKAAAQVLQLVANKSVLTDGEKSAKEVNTRRLAK